LQEEEASNTIISSNIVKSKAILLELVYLWHVRLNYIGLKLLKKIAKTIKGMPDLSFVKEEEFDCLACNRSKIV